MRRTRFADYLAAWEMLNQGLKANLGDLPTFTDVQAELETAIQGVSDLNHVQETLKAERIQTTKDLTEKFRTTRQVEARLRASLRGHYGPTAEKLGEFGVKPLRPPRRKRATGEPAPAPPPQEKSVSTG